MDVRALRRIDVFSSLSEPQLREAMDVAMKYFEVGDGEILLVQGEQDTSLIIVVEGELEVLTGNPPVRLATLGKGQLIGDMALFGRANVRSATVRTLTDCELIHLDVDGMAALQKLNHPLVPALEAAALKVIGRRLRMMDELITQLAVGTKLERPEPKSGLSGWFSNLLGGGDEGEPTGRPPNPVEVLQKCGVFNTRDPKILKHIASLFEPVAVAQHDFIIQEGETGEDAYIIADGQVEVYRATRMLTQERVARLGPGAFFGLVSLVHGKARSASCLASAPTWLLKLSGEKFREVVEQDVPEARVLRFALFDALSHQLAMANKHAAILALALGKKKHIAGAEEQAYKEMVSGVTAYPGPEGGPPNT